MNLTTAENSVNVQVDFKAAEIKDIVAQDFLKKRKNWSNSPTSEYVTTFSEGLLKSMTNRVHMYRFKRVGESIFQVEFIGLDMLRTQKKINKNKVEPICSISDVPFHFFSVSRL